jgi:eukaryotic-like serine/threonine-protein kinase
MTGLARYEHIRRLGGAMGTVHLAQDRVLGRLVALKRLRPELDDLEFKRRFAREAMILAQLQHPHVISVFDYFEEDGDPILVMEYIDGDTLRTIITEKRPIALVQKLAIIEDLAAGLACVHEAGIIHRDIKPGNVMVTRTGVVKLLDFGVAKPPGTALTSHGAVIGTPNYMSPEQVRGDVLDPRSDLFSLSALLYELVTLVPPFSGDFLQVARAILEKHPPSLRSLEPALPDGLDALVRQGLAKDPTHRPRSADEFRAALQAVRLGTLEAPTVHDDVPAAPRLDPPDVPAVHDASAPGGIFASGAEETSDRRRLYAFAAAGAVLILVMVVLGFWSRPAATAPIVRPAPSGSGLGPGPTAGAPVASKGKGEPPARRPRTTQTKQTAELEPRAAGQPSAPDTNPAIPTTGGTGPETPVNPPESPAAPGAVPTPSGSATGGSARIDVNTSDDRPAVEQLLADFARAHNERNVPALKQLYPSLPQAEAIALTRAFVDYEAYRVSLSDVLVSLAGDHGRVRCRMTRAITPSKGDARIVNAVLDAAVQRVDGAWVFTRLTLQ